MAAARILVVGGGIAGLAVARALSRAGFSAEVAERELTWAEAGTGVYLPGNAARALRALGLEEAVSERGFVIPRQRVADDRGRLLVEVDLAKLWDGVGACLALHRADLRAVLLDGARDVPIRMGVDVRALSERDDRVVVAFGDGTEGEYDLVIGADGIHSTVRRLVFGGGATARSLGQVGWRFVTDCPPEITTWSVMLGHRTAFLTIPIGNGRVYCYCDVVSPAAGGRHDDLGRLFAGFAEPVGQPARSVPDRDSCTARRSRRSRSTPGCAAGWCSSGTPRTPPRPTWPRALRWRWKTRWAWRMPASAGNDPGSPVAFEARRRPRTALGPARRRIAATEPASLPPRFEMWFCGPSVEDFRSNSIDLSLDEP